MKRRSLIIALLLVAALALCVGYANMTRILTVTGDGVLNRVDDAFVVEFLEDWTLTDGQGEEAGTITISNGGRTAEISLSGLSHKNDTVTAIMTVQNNSTVDDLIAQLVNVTLSDYSVFDEVGSEIDEENQLGQALLTITCAIKNEAGETIWSNSAPDTLSHQYLAQGEKATVTMVFTLNETVLQNEKIQLKDADLTLNFSAVKEIPDGSGGGQG